MRTWFDYAIEWTLAGIAVGATYSAITILIQLNSSS